MTFVAMEVKAKDLKPGDIFSKRCEAYWENLNPQSIAEMVFIRTEVPLPEDNKEIDVYLIKAIGADDKRGAK